MKPKFFFDQIFAVQQHISELSGEDLIAGKAIETIFTDYVDAMRSEACFPESIRECANLLWDLVVNFITPVAATEAHGKENQKAYILTPINWHRLVQENPYYQAGAIIFAGSQAKDYWNLRINERTMVQKRAWCYEAVLLRHFAEHQSDFVPNEYQQHVMKFHPESLFNELYYKSRPFDLKAGPPYPLIPKPIAHQSN